MREAMGRAGSWGFTYPAPDVNDRPAYGAEGPRATGLGVEVQRYHAGVDDAPPPRGRGPQGGGLEVSAQISAVQLSRLTSMTGPPIGPRGQGPQGARASKCCRASSSKALSSAACHKSGMRWYAVL